MQMIKNCCFLFCKLALSWLNGTSRISCQMINFSFIMVICRKLSTGYFSQLLRLIVQIHELTSPYVQSLLIYNVSKTCRGFNLIAALLENSLDRTSQRKIFVSTSWLFANVTVSARLDHKICQWLEFSLKVWVIWPTISSKNDTHYCPIKLKHVLNFWSKLCSAIQTISGFL